MLGITALVIFAVSQAPAGSWCSLIALRPRPHVLDAQLAHCSNTIPRGVAVAPQGRGAPKLCPIASHRWVHGKSPSSNSSGLFGQVFCGCWVFFSSFFPFFLSPPPTSKLRSCRRARISAKHKQSSPMRSVRGNSFMSEKGSAWEFVAKEPAWLLLIETTRAVPGCVLGSGLLGWEQRWFPPMQSCFLSCPSKEGLDSEV